MILHRGRYLLNKKYYPSIPNTLLHVWPSSVSQSADIKGFSKDWNQSVAGDGRKRKRVADEKATDNGDRKVVEVRDFDFTTMHNLIFFLYTGVFNVHTEDDLQPETEATGYPEPCDAITLYAAANMLLVSDLESILERCLTLTCSEENIVPRLFDLNLKHLEKLQNVYFDYFTQGRVFKAVKQRPEFIAIIESFGGDDPESIYRKDILVKFLAKAQIVTGESNRDVK
jgi:hypothetical protein